MKSIAIGGGIPLQRETKEKVKELYGYGCVFCGHPICKVYSDESGPYLDKSPEKFVLLCQKHFLDKKNGKLAPSALDAAKRHPFNINESNGEIAASYKFDSSVKIELHVGPFVMEWQEASFDYSCKTPLMVDGTVLFQLMKVKGYLSFGVTLLDEYNNILLLIQDNIIEYCKDFIEILYSDNKLIIKGEQKELLFELVYQDPNKVYITKGNYLINGVELQILNEKIFVNNEELKADGSAVVATQIVTLLSIGENKNLQSHVNIKNLNRYA